MDAISKTGNTGAHMQPNIVIRVLDNSNAKKRTVPARAELHRMNFLLQASTLMLRQTRSPASTALPPDQSEAAQVPAITKPGRMTRAEKRAAKKGTKLKPVRMELKDQMPSASLSRILAQQARQVGKKAVLRMAPETKQRICTRCSLQLEPDVTSTVRFRRNKSKVLFKVTTCLSCKTVSRIRMDPKYEPKGAALPAEEVS
ncbi:hypothetical protein RvY_05993 [Ramazzottius varieornatus]|uniref:Uncharacterized protein n=1 Tax=Ramazzottius varieornatus TaxID=947166 RepID=A0A1D1V6M8_RAMVA|nr:hypothetical protein RvY_05993 [Ramazzottius varieornatus]